MIQYRVHLGPSTKVCRAGNTLEIEFDNSTPFLNHGGTRMEIEHIDVYLSGDDKKFKIAGAELGPRSFLDEGYVKLEGGLLPRWNWVRGPSTLTLRFEAPSDVGWCTDWQLAASEDTPAAVIKVKIKRQGAANDTAVDCATWPDIC